MCSSSIFQQSQVTSAWAQRKISNDQRICNMVSWRNHLVVSYGNSRLTILKNVLAFIVQMQFRVAVRTAYVYIRTLYHNGSLDDVHPVAKIIHCRLHNS